MAQDGFDHDGLIVGSGSGGSVSALRLSEKGCRVTVTECGRRYRDYAATTWNLRRFMWAPPLGLRGRFGDIGLRTEQDPDKPNPAFIPVNPSPTITAITEHAMSQIPPAQAARV